MRTQGPQRRQKFCTLIGIKGEEPLGLTRGLKCLEAADFTYPGRLLPSSFPGGTREVQPSPTPTTHPPMNMHGHFPLSEVQTVCVLQQTLCSCGPPQPPQHLTGSSERVVSEAIKLHCSDQSDGAVQTRNCKAEAHSRCAAQQMPVGTEQGSTWAVWGQCPQLQPCPGGHSPPHPPAGAVLCTAPRGLATTAGRKGKCGTSGCNFCLSV